MVPPTVCVEGRGGTPLLCVQVRDGTPYCICGEVMVPPVLYIVVRGYNNACCTLEENSFWGCWV